MKKPKPKKRMSELLEMEDVKTFEFKVNGFTFKSDGLYQIVPKPDMDAPDGFIKFGTSKLLMEGIQESAPCRFDERKGLWDTGFYPDSPCYRGRKSEDIATEVAALEKYIKRPYEEIRGENFLKASKDNNAFWDNFGGRLYNGRVFNVANEQDLLELYMAIRHYRLVMPEDKSKPFARDAKYCIIDKEAAVSVKEQRQMEKAEAIGTFISMYDNDRKMLFNILEYVGLVSTRDIDKKTLTSMIMQYFEDPKQGYASVNRFTECKKRSNFPKGKEEFEIFAALTNLRRSRKITQEYQEYYLDGVVLGSNLKDATARVMKDKDLKMKIAEALEK